MRSKPRPPHEGGRRYRRRGAAAASTTSRLPESSAAATSSARRTSSPSTSARRANARSIPAPTRSGCSTGAAGSCASLNVAGSSSSASGFPCVSSMSRPDARQAPPRRRARPPLPPVARPASTSVSIPAASNGTARRRARRRSMRRDRHQASAAKRSASRDAASSHCASSTSTSSGRVPAAAASSPSDAAPMANRSIGRGGPSASAVRMSSAETRGARPHARAAAEGLRRAPRTAARARSPRPCVQTIAAAGLLARVLEQRRLADARARRDGERAAATGRRFLGEAGRFALARAPPYEHPLGIHTSKSGGFPDAIATASARRSAGGSGGLLEAARRHDLECEPGVLRRTEAELPDGVRLDSELLFADRDGVPGTRDDRLRFARASSASGRSARASSPRPACPVCATEP